MPSDDARKGIEHSWSAFFIEVRAVATLAAPVAGTYLLSFMLNISSALIVGHVSATALAASALGNMFANATGFSITYGACSAVDTLSSQAFGANNLARVGYISQRGMLVRKKVDLR